MNQKQVDLSVQDSTMGQEPYTKPEVITFGSVAKLTLGGSGTRPDVGNPAGSNNGLGNGN